MQVVIDTASAEPLFEQVVAQIRGAILAGEVRPGEKLPSAKDLAAGLDVNQHTVLHAYQALRDEGFIELRRGRGATVRADHPYPDAKLLRAIETVRRAAADSGVPLNTVIHLLKEPQS
ncbi:GntR family transcriptional regulator [Georgenia sp. Z1344]|uniref:GntR family transcriptional regulator n=1 Tax=Georgenia sp. Z1344 TaxID=3416706 RepID=UPI003CF8BEEB